MDIHENKKGDTEAKKYDLGQATTQSPERGR
jgi:hypothetical protein